MNQKIFLLFFLFVFGCASVEEMNLNIANLEGYKISTAVAVLGNPTNSVELEDERIFTWVSSDTMDIPIGGYDYGSDAYGNPVSTWNPSQSNIDIPMLCKITIHTSKDFCIYNSVVEGDGIQCNAYDEKLKRLNNLTKQSCYTALTDVVTLKAPLASPTFTGNISFPDDTVDVAHYSLFVESDFDGILVLGQKKSGELSGFVKSFGGYLWLERTYGDPTKKSLTFIQERNLKNLEGAEMESFMNVKDIVTPFFYNFRKSDDDQIVDFLSPGANAKINGFLSRGETFSLATLTEEAWYAGVYTPVKNIDSLELWAKSNGRSFCQWINSPLATNVLNKELNTRYLSKLMSDEGYSCDKYFNLIN